MPEFTLSNWMLRLKQAEVSDWKEPFFILLRPVLNLHGRSKLKQSSLARYTANLVLPGRDMPLRARQRWGYAHKQLSVNVIFEAAWL
jgi:hypothetical protein